MYKAAFPGLRGGYPYGAVAGNFGSDEYNQNREKIQTHGDALADKLQRNIAIDCGFSSPYHLGSRLWQLCFNNAYVNCQGHTCDGLILFGRSNDVMWYAHECDCRKLMEDVEQIVWHMADHPFTLREKSQNGKALGYGFSPYIRDIDALGDLASILVKVLDSLNPGFNDLYEVMVLDPSETVYYPGRSCTILFLKKNV